MSAVNASYQNKRNLAIPEQIEIAGFYGQGASRFAVCAALGYLSTCLK